MTIPFSHSGRPRKNSSNHILHFIECKHGQKVGPKDKANMINQENGRYQNLRSIEQICKPINRSNVNSGNTIL